MARPVSADKAAGCLVASALGDALGFLVEGGEPGYCADYAAGTFGSMDPPWLEKDDFAFGQYSDDTQLTRELALSLIACRGFDPANYARRIAQIFADDLVVGWGEATANAADRLIAGRNWQHSGEPAPSAGNGAAMRVAPIALVFRDPTKRRGAAEMQASITHRDPRSRAAAQLVAEAVWIAATESNPRQPANLQRMAEACDELDPRLSNAVRNMERTLTMADDKALAYIKAVGRDPASPYPELVGISPFAPPSSLFALYCFLRAPNDPAEVLRSCIAAGGDTDTTACMAGAMVGARVGLAGLGEQLTGFAEHLNDRGAFGKKDFLALAKRLVSD